MQIASIFQNHMVLQRERPVPIWGWAEPGVRVEVFLAKAGEAASAVTGPDGQWRVMLPPQPAGGPYELQVREGGCVQRFQDVWVGEVWVASGQSNMQMTVVDSNDAVAEIAAAIYPGIRMLTAARVSPMVRQNHLGSGSEWRACTPEAVGKFSAVAYFFARELHLKLGVAVGVIDSSWGGTVAEAWTSRQGLQVEPSLMSHIDKLDQFLGPEGEALRLALKKAADEWTNSIRKDPGNLGLEMGWAAPDAKDCDWKTACLPNVWQSFGFDISGVFWFRREITVPASWAGRDLSLNIGGCDKRDFTYFNGEFMGSLGMEDRPDAWCVPRQYTVPGRLVKAGRNVVAVRVFSNIFHGGMNGPAAMMWVGPQDDDTQRQSLAGEWRYRIERDFGKVPAQPPVSFGEENPNTPTALFNGMIAPLVPYAIRGFIWYQGESNASRPAEYRVLFPAMIRDWRREWGQEDLSFYFVQLANFMVRNETPVDTDWARLREAQRFTLSVVPRTGMAVIIDIGEVGDIHPKNKQDVGRRLAACALAQDYGQADAIGSSPLPAAAWVTGPSVTIRFDYAGGGLAVRGPSLLGFAVAGEDRIFHWADAAVSGVDRVMLSSSDVGTPRWVRYAWSNNPACNLVGGTGLPASPFEMAVPGGAWLKDV